MVFLLSAVWWEMDSKIKKEDFWKSHIEAWFKTPLSQVEYCHTHSLSNSSFTKWKQKLYPDWKRRKSNYKPKSKYGTGLKLSDPQIEELAKLYFESYSARNAAEKMSLSANTVNQYFSDFRRVLLYSALRYPHLFFGAGTLIYLGKSPISERLEEEFQKDERGFKDDKRKRLIVMTETIIHYSKFKWELGETLLFLKLSKQSYFCQLYCKEKNIEPTEENFLSISEEDLDAHFSLGEGFAMRMWLMEEFVDGRKYPADEAAWITIFYKRKLNTPKTWIKQIHRDFLWALTNHKINFKKWKRNKYYDDLIFSRKNEHLYEMAFESFQKNLDELPKNEITYDFVDFFGIW